MFDFEPTKLNTRICVTSDLCSKRQGIFEGDSSPILLQAVIRFKSSSQTPFEADLKYALWVSWTRRRKRKSWHSSEKDASFSGSLYMEESN